MYKKENKSVEHRYSLVWMRNAKENGFLSKEKEATQVILLQGSDRTYDRAFKI